MKSLGREESERRGWEEVEGPAEELGKSVLRKRRHSGSWKPGKKVREVGVRCWMLLRVFKREGRKGQKDVTWTCMHLFMSA